MAAAPSSEPGPESGRRPLTAPERLVCGGAIAVAGSLLFPWYGIRFSDGLSVTGLDSFGFAAAALLLTAGAAVAVVIRLAAGLPPRPLSPAWLVIVAGAWALVLTAYLMADRPDQLAGSTGIGLRFGIYVALGGCVAIIVGGLRMRS